MKFQGQFISLWHRLRKQGHLERHRSRPEFLALRVLYTALTPYQHDLARGVLDEIRPQGI